MIDTFEDVSIEGFPRIVKAIGESPSPLCDFTPFVIFLWRDFYKTKYAFLESSLVFRHTVTCGECFSPLAPDIVTAVEELFEKEGKDTLTLSLIRENDLEKLKENFTVEDVRTDDSWWDYIYLHEDLSSFRGKRYSGERNHINKFLASVTEWHYEEINSRNIAEVLDFYRELSKDTEEFDETALYEREKLLTYMEDGYKHLPLSGGLIRADGEIVSFAFGEVLGDMLFVHVEKARRDKAGAYQMIVREFARHNPARLINREEDMGLEGLRRSKESYHPIEKLKKYTLTVKR